MLAHALKRAQRNSEVSQVPFKAIIVRTHQLRLNNESPKLNHICDRYRARRYDIKSGAVGSLRAITVDSSSTPSAYQCFLLAACSLLLSDISRMSQPPRANRTLPDLFPFSFYRQEFDLQSYRTAWLQLIRLSYHILLFHKVKIWQLRGYGPPNYRKGSPLFRSRPPELKYLRMLIYYYFV